MKPFHDGSYTFLSILVWVVICFRVSHNGLAAGCTYSKRSGSVCVLQACVSGLRGRGAGVGIKTEKEVGKCREAMR